MIKLSVEKTDLQRTLRSLFLIFQKNLNFIFCFCEEFSLQNKRNIDVEDENFENMFFNPFHFQKIF